MGNVVELDPGSRLTIGETTVVCKGGDEQVLRTFCNCANIGQHYMVNLDYVVLMANGRQTSTLLGRYGDVAACERALATKEFCE